MDEMLLQSGRVAETVSIELVAGFMVTLSSGLVAYYARQLHKDWDKRADKVDKLYQAFFGMDDVSTMEGIVDVVESHNSELDKHDTRIEELEEKIQEGKRRREDLNRRVNKLKEKNE